LVVPEGEDITREEALEIIAESYDTIYSYRQAYKIHEMEGNDSMLSTIEDWIREEYRTIHRYWQPMPHRKKLHDLLNSMEYYNVDQMMDTTASKNATLLPVDLEKGAKEIDSDRTYINVGLSSLPVENEFKYNQVETS